MTDTERDALANLIHDQWQDGRDGYEAADAVRAWMRENCYEKREPVIVDGLMAERALVAYVGGLDEWDEYSPTARTMMRADMSDALVAALAPDGQEKDQ